MRAQRYLIHSRLSLELERAWARARKPGPVKARNR